MLDRQCQINQSSLSNAWSKNEWRFFLNTKHCNWRVEDCLAQESWFPSSSITSMRTWIRREMNPHLHCSWQHQILMFIFNLGEQVNYIGHTSYQESKSCTSKMVPVAHSRRRAREYLPFLLFIFETTEVCFGSPKRKFYHTEGSPS